MHKKKAKQDKTNVMRLLEQHGVDYQAYYFPTKEALSGVQVAALLKEDPARVFKTLVTVGSRTGEHFVFVIPVEKELDLKKAARAVGEKAIAMIHAKELLPLTGYIHGGCSPIGMKKFFRTTVDSSARDCGTIFFSAGRIGCQVETAPADLEKMIPLSYAALTVEGGEA
ncbi:MAG: Cys-tRNA(Pro) deacylase [Eubacteriales bacterium]|jgi:Cys-tRNA(Pro)/Cys-tRNA(Cys) deacylase|nr:Cys-tRNA(Pro) deacylase [Eubacteriales bacterium]